MMQHSFGASRSVSGGMSTRRTERIRAATANIRQLTVTVEIQSPAACCGEGQEEEQQTEHPRACGSHREQETCGTCITSISPRQYRMRLQLANLNEPVSCKQARIEHGRVRAGTQGLQSALSQATRQTLQDSLAGVIKAAVCRQHLDRMGRSFGHRLGAGRTHT